MKIIWLGHGSFRIEIADKVLLLDPWLNGNPMLSADQHAAATAGATHILLTHGHFDHVVDVLDLARKHAVPVVGQYDLMSHWAEAEKIETIGFNKGGTVDHRCRAGHLRPSDRLDCETDRESGNSKVRHLPSNLRAPFPIGDPKDRLPSVSSFANASRLGPDADARPCPSSSSLRLL